MSELETQYNDFLMFKKKYEVILEKFLIEEEISENYLNEGYKLGRLAVSGNLGILGVAAIHHDCLIDFLEKLETDNHVVIADKASTFLEEVLSSYQMIAEDFRDAVNLLNKRSVEFAVRIRALQESVKEKESLLKEIHHRVKNNLQFISSLFNLQIEATQDPLSQQVLIKGSTRVKSMALIHEMLYQSDNLAKIVMDDYLKILFRYLYEIYDIDPDKIKYTLDVDPIFFGLDKAIPFGLIINELITNVFKHAFPDDKVGEIKLFFKKTDNIVTMIISDNGVGIASDVDIHQLPSLGMSLIYNLTKQLNGVISLDRHQGTTFKLSFTDSVT